MNERLLLVPLLLLTASPSFAGRLKLRTTVLDGRPAELVESLSLQGDLRLRHETFNHKSGGAAARQRQRLRLRIGSTIRLPQNLSIGLRLASGTGEQGSANQSFDDAAGQKGIWLDRAFLQWSPCASEGRRCSLTAGKMENPLWRIYSSDILWDKDVSPEGLGQSVEWSGEGGAFFLNAMQAPVDEDSGDEADQWLLAGQAGGELGLAHGIRFRAAAALYHWINERMSDFGQPTTNEGNRRITGTNTLANEFSICELTGQLSAEAAGVPFRLQGTYIINTAASMGLRPKENTGYQVGAILGMAKKPGSWETAYFYKFSRTDAAVADLADSDFGDGGTNRKGHILWAAYNIQDWLRVKAKFNSTEVISNALPPGEDDINRGQVDLSVKF